MTHWGPFESLIEAFKGKFASDRDLCPDEDERRTDYASNPESGLPFAFDEPAPWRLNAVGAWTGFGSFGRESSMIRDLKFAQSLGFGRMDVIVNDHSGKRSPQGFDTYDKAKLIQYCRMLVAAGFKVHLMSWCMPHEEYLREAGTQLQDLMDQTRATSIMLDAEEPWTKARNPMDWSDAAALTAEVLDGVRWGVTGIGYASAQKLGPLVRRADYMLPQCYSTARNKLDPTSASRKLSDRWRTKMGGDAKLVVGLAGYSQKGRGGYTKERFMTSAFESAMSAEPTDIVYWSLRHIRKTGSTAKIIRALTQHAAYRVVS